MCHFNFNIKKTPVSTRGLPRLTHGREMQKKTMGERCKNFEILLIIGFRYLDKYMIFYLLIWVNFIFKGYFVHLPFTG